MTLMADNKISDIYTLAAKPTVIPVPGEKLIEEFIGKLNTGTDGVSVAHMIAPPGWSEPAQTPNFDEITIMIKGRMQIETDEETLELKAGETILINKNNRVRYCNPYNEPSEYWAVCMPAFTPETANREQD
jgi:mannose-6-phosphate isomerase-like protein (cupin superfamily)